MTLRAGLTGGIGSGKSTVAKIFVEFKIPVIDADDISHQLTQPNGQALPSIKMAFSDSVFLSDGTLNRANLRSIVFQSPPKRKLLEGIMHPLIRSQMQKQYQAYVNKHDIVVFDIPLLAPNSKWLDWCDRILLIDCSQHTQIQRVMRRAGWTHEQAQQVIAQQASREQRLSIASDIINNDNITIANLRQQVDAIIMHWRKVHDEKKASTD